MGKMLIFLIFKALLLSFSLLPYHTKAESLNASNSSTSIFLNELAKCNHFSGKWVYDKSYPLYQSSNCPFIDPEFNCQKYGRPDNLYQNYRWQPNRCSIPRFNGLQFLNKWRGKKIMFVGDSLSLNMWQSLSCMIHASVPNAKTTYFKRESFGSVTFKMYKFTSSIKSSNVSLVKGDNVEGHGPILSSHRMGDNTPKTVKRTHQYGVKLLLYHTTFLVDIEKESKGRILKLDSIKAGNSWRGMDMLIFNSWHWWTHTGRTQPWDYIQDGNKLYKDMDRLVAYYKGLTTWARWVNRYVDSSKTKVFFQGISPTHYEGRDWNQPSKSCNAQTQPLFNAKYPGGPPPAAIVVNKVLSRIKKPVYLLDVTTLSQFRKDAHPTLYSGDHRGTTDCSHWCLPGLPDTWNELLYAALFS